MIFFVDRRLRLLYNTGGMALLSRVLSKTTSNQKGGVGMDPSGGQHRQAGLEEPPIRTPFRAAV